MTGPLRPLATALSAMLIIVLWASSSAATAQSVVTKPAQTNTDAASGPKKWAALSTSEKAALQPLASEWSGIDVDRQKKWLEISKNFATMTPEQQSALHSRMSEWAKLSPAERNRARINFVQSREATKALSADEKRAKWEAYQALSPEERRKLAGSQPTPKGAAVVTTPTPTQRLASTPSSLTKTTATSRTPRIVASPDQVKANTLLPQPKDPASSKQ
jgi:hypothetical protein